MIDFVRYRGLMAVYSLCVILSFVGVAIYKKSTRGYIFNYSIDFTGGTQVLLKFDKPVSVPVIHNALNKEGWQGAVVRDFSPQEILIRVKEFSNDVQGLAGRIRTVIQQALPDTQVTILQSEAVGAGVGETLQWKSIYAVLIALVAMLAYIAFRFWSFAFAFGAVVALFHDAIVMLATFLFLDREISVNVIGAILAVLGYSINDTIVIFAQIRQNLKEMSRASLREIVNVSINQTLRRTILTSFATALTVVAMFFLGGEALRDFSLALMVGIVFGTYSSIYIASPVMMLLYRKEK